MEKNILIISSEFTGHGHKSICEALCGAFEKYKGSINIEVVNGFSLGEAFGTFLERNYNFMITYIPFLYKIIYEFSSRFKDYANKITIKKMGNNFLKIIEKFKPSAIITIHPVFVGSILDILEKNNINIPFITVLADLVSFSRLWADPRSILTICPNEEASDLMKKFGVLSDKIRVIGFPVRKRFFNNLQSKVDSKGRSGKTISILFINGSERIEKVIRMAQMLLKNFDCRLTIITGRNEKMKNRLDIRLLPGNEDKLTILGYIKEMEIYFSSHDILIARGGPNTLMEAVSSGIPVIITGALPGQEEKNPDFMVRRSLGIFCPSIGKMKKAVENLLADKNKSLNKIRENQLNFRNPDCADQIAGIIAGIVKD